MLSTFSKSNSSLYTKLNIGTQYWYYTVRTPGPVCYEQTELVQSHCLLVQLIVYLCFTLKLSILICHHTVRNDDRLVTSIVQCPLSWQDRVKQSIILELGTVPVSSVQYNCIIITIYKCRFSTLHELFDICCVEIILYTFSLILHIIY